MAKYVLGRVVPIYRGSYDPMELYEPLDIVLYSGSTFICLADTQGNTPTENDTTYWGLMAKHGEREELTPEEIATLETVVYNNMVSRGVIFDAQYTHTDNNYSDADKATVTDIQDNPTKYVNTQSDWNEANTTSPAYIKNKPDFIQDANYTHTDNNYTTAEKSKLAAIDAHAQQNVQADWSTTDTNADSFIKHKPTIPTATNQLINNSNFVVDANYTHNPNPFTDAYKNKLDTTNVFTDGLLQKLNGIETGAEINVQADWNVTNTSSDAYIKNKPNVTLQPTETTVTATTYTISNLQSNYVYKFTNPITSLTITAANVGYNPTLLYFTTGNTFTWSFPNSLKTTQYVDFDPNQSYVVAVMNNIVTYAEVD